LKKARTKGWVKGRRDAAVTSLDVAIDQMARGIDLVLQCALQSKDEGNIEQYHKFNDNWIDLEKCRDLTGKVRHKLRRMEIS